ncbi:MAG TPA: carboxy terminal-processing peptidase [Chthoniobacterales bacterium]|jgi:carboxyl-terminal processing protease|nr:carboxy terminal-processing peptidase [Chthoniobacterales bacterium]
MKIFKYLVVSLTLVSVTTLSQGQLKSNTVDSRQVAITVAKLLEQAHFTRQKLDSSMSRKVLDTYLESLDYTKLFFTQEDIDKIHQKYDGTLDQDLIVGNVQPARDIYGTFKERVESRAAKIRKLVNENFTFKSTRTVALDRRKEPWPANEQDADNLWRDRIEGELLQEKLNKLAIDPGPKVVSKRYDQLVKNLEERDDNDVLQLFLNAVAQTYDPHSEYLGKGDLESFEINMRLSLTGIGAELRVEDGYAKIERLIPGGPAQMSGKVSVGDRIAAVSQGKDNFVDVVDMKLEKVVELIRGKKGSTVRLQIIPSDTSDPSKRKVVELVRDNVKLTEQEAKAELIDRTLPDGTTQKLGWITLPSFYQDMERSRTGKSTSRDVAALIKRLEQEGIQGLVIDLRRNGGGSLDEAIKMTGLFITQGPVVQVKESGGDIEVLKDRDPSVAYSGPLIILVNKLSASASEIFAAALQDYGRAVIVGDSSTFGKGTVQTLLELGRFIPLLGGSSNDAGALKLTVQKFYRVAGGSTQLHGVSSDVVLPSLSDNAEIGESALEHPLAYDEVEPAAIDVANNHKQLFIDDLKKRSTNRIAQDQSFQDILADAKELKDRLKSNRLSLNEKNRRDQLDKDNGQKQKEQADEKKIQGQVHDKRFELTLADVDKPQLKAIEKTPAQKDQKAQDNNSNTSDPNATIEDENGTTLDADAIRRETLNIATDLVDLVKTPRTAGR